MSSSWMREGSFLAARRHQLGVDLGAVLKASWAFEELELSSSTRDKAPKKQKPRWRGALCKVSGGLET